MILKVFCAFYVLSRTFEFYRIGVCLRRNHPIPRALRLPLAPLPLGAAGRDVPPLVQGVQKLLEHLTWFYYDVQGSSFGMR